MQIYKFKLYGGYTVTITDSDVKIDYAGEKWWFITRSKPRTKTIPLKDVIRIDTKSSGMTFGYVRFITPAIDEYPSSSYIARHDEYSFMVEKDEADTLNRLLEGIRKKHKHLPIVQCKN